VTSRPVRAWAAVIVFLGLSATAIQLGLWQLGRADEKQAMIDLRTGRQTPAAWGSPEGGADRKVAVLVIDCSR
jgi:cytochrome oxidase assembly protein ShyY1